MVVSKFLATKHEWRWWFHQPLFHELRNQTKSVSNNVEHEFETLRMVLPRCYSLVHQCSYFPQCRSDSFENRKRNVGNGITMKSLLLEHRFGIGFGQNSAQHESLGALESSEFGERSRFQYYWSQSFESSRETWIKLYLRMPGDRSGHCKANSESDEMYPRHRWTWNLKYWATSSSLSSAILYSSIFAEQFRF